MRETLGAIAGAVLAYAACAFVAGDVNGANWTQGARFLCIFAMYCFAGLGALFAGSGRAS